jgi:D-sedoheptulose 7-phosphate isomerase
MNDQNSTKINEIVKQSIVTISKIEIFSENIIQITNHIVNAISVGKKVIIFGNGGSAADAQHIAAELIGRFSLERKSYPAIALTTDTSALTAIANDYAFDQVFSRQCQGLVNDGDVVIGISTSGNSENVKRGLEVSNEKNAFTIGLLGNGGGKIKDIVNISISIESKSTPRIQESHRVIYHIICQMVEEKLYEMEKDNERQS